MPAWKLLVAVLGVAFAPIAVAAHDTLTSVQVAPSRSHLSAGPNAWVTIPIVEPNTLFEDCRRQLDLRLSRTFRAASTGLLATIELYNALNASPLLAANATYGARWLEPVEILSGRLLKCGAQGTCYGWERSRDQRGGRP